MPKIDTGVLLVFAVFFIIALYTGLLMVQQTGRSGPSGANASKIEEHFMSVSLEKLEVKFFGLVTPDEDSINSFISNADKFAWVSPTGSEINAYGALSPRIERRIIEAARNNNVSVVPLVANSGFDRDLVHRILTDPEVRRHTITDIVNFVVENNFSGINIDYENIPPEDRAALNSYMKELASKLHSYGKIVTIDVSGKTWDDTSGWGGAWDYKVLGETCDYICIMCYDYHWSGSEAGPIGPLGWLKDVIRYALSAIPEEKIVIGIPFYGYKWLGRNGVYLTFRQALETAKNMSVEVLFSEEDAEYHYSYGSYEVWFQGAKSIEIKVSTVLSYGIDKIAAWRIGQEDHRTWEVISRKP
ncbi:MAG: glycosyl hydrolase family 18 protein [Thermoproteota archaeon]